MNVLMLSKYDRMGASSRLRSMQYFPYLSGRGVCITHKPLFGDDYLRSLYGEKKRPIREIFLSYLSRFKILLTVKKYDLVWIEKEAFPWLPAIVELYLLKSGVPYVVDYDDAIFHNYDLNSRTIVRKLLGTKIDKVMQNAALVIAGNDYLASRAAQAGANRVEVIPTVVDINRYDMKDSQGDIFRVGWMGSPSTQKYLACVEGALKRLSQEYPIELVVVGASQFQMDGVDVTVKRWTEDSEAAEIQGFDVGIMPLPDEPWEKGKCGYKLIQYMACGKPVIASPVGVNNDIVKLGVNGFLADAENEWFNALKCLVDDKKLRQQMGANGRALVVAHYCIDAVQSTLFESLSSIVRR